MEDIPSFVTLMSDSSNAAPLNASAKAVAEVVEAPCLGHKLHVCDGTLQTSLCIPHDTVCSTQHLTVRRPSSIFSNFSNKHDGTLVFVSKKANPLDELPSVPENTPTNELDNITALTATERGEEPQAVDTLPCGSDDPDHGEFAVVLQSSSLTMTHVDNLTSENQDVVKDHQEKASKLVAQLIRLIDGSLPDKEVLGQLRMSHINRHNFDGATGYLIMFYDVKSAAEDAKRPVNRKPAVRKAHLDRLMSLTLQSLICGWRTPSRLSDLMMQS
jgi:hypothetical protein